MLGLLRGLLFPLAQPLFPKHFIIQQCGWAAKGNFLQDCLCVFFFSDLNTPFSMSTASPNNPTVHGDLGEFALHCWIRSSYPGCVPAVLCPAGLRVTFPPHVKIFKKISQNNLSYFWWFECLLSCSILSLTKGNENSKEHGIDYLLITPKKYIPQWW